MRDGLSGACDPADARVTVRDSRIMAAALALAATAIATAIHEAIGHGSVCLASGGTITQLTSVYFACSAKSDWIAAGGPAAHLLAGVLAWLALGLLPIGFARLRLLLLLVMALSLFWEAGYLLYAAVTDGGDWAFIARGLLGANPGWHVGAFALGLGLYYASMTVVAHAARPFGDAGRLRPLLQTAWLAATSAACVAALFYAPDRLSALRQAALEVGAASLPLLLIPARVRSGGAAEGPLERSPAWFAAVFLLYAGFVVALGRGLPR